LPALNCHPFYGGQRKNADRQGTALRPRFPSHPEQVVDRAEYVLEARNIVMGFSGAPVLKNTSLRVADKGILGIVGPNGAGKTTLFNVFAGLLRPWKGHVLLDGQDITGLTPAARARRGLARTFQLSRELGSLTVLENLLLAAPAQPGESGLNVFFSRRTIRRAEEQATEKALSLLRRVHLAPFADHLAGALSGGQKKLLELCRALMLNPRVILLDEPAAGVNPLLMAELTDYLRGLREQGQTFAVVEHNMDMVSALCDWVYVLVDGAVIAEGLFNTVIADNVVQDAYVGGLGI
jgi:ABC-type branched-subunit amino acid transport system ATPase component